MGFRQAASQRQPNPVSADFRQDRNYRNRTRHIPSGQGLIDNCGLADSSDNAHDEFAALEARAGVCGFNLTRNDHRVADIDAITFQITNPNNWHAIGNVLAWLHYAVSNSSLGIY